MKNKCEKILLFIIFSIVMSISIILISNNKYLNKKNSIAEDVNITNAFIAAYDNKLGSVFGGKLSGEDDEEIVLGDNTSNCSETETNCSVGELRDGTCQVWEDNRTTVWVPESQSCVTVALVGVICTTIPGHNETRGSAQWVDAGVSPTTVCKTCNDGFQSNGSGGCKKCAKGSAGTGGSCSSCPAGKYSDVTGAKKCKDCGANQYSTGGASSCSNCFGDVSNDHSTCYECKITSFDIEENASAGCQEPGTRIGLKATFEHCSRYTPVYSPGRSFTTPNSCGTVTASVKVSGDGGSDRKTLSIGTKDSWRYVGTIVTTNPLPSQGGANGSCSNIYGNCTIHQAGLPYYLCTNVHVRCTASASSYSVPHYNFCCMDREYLGLATRTKWYEYWPKKECPSPYTNLLLQTDSNKDKVKENTCVTYEVPSYCTSRPLSDTAQHVVTNKCEGDKSINLRSEGKKCVNGRDSFYNISCDKTITANFDYGDDGSSNTDRSLYAGQGFKFKVKLSTVVTCTATFNATAWNNVYDKLIKKIEYIDNYLLNYCKNGNYNQWDNRIKQLKNRDSLSDQSERELYRLFNTIEEIRDIVIAYNEFKPSEDYDENASLSVEYQTDNSQTTKTDLYTLVKTLNAGSYQITKVGTQPSIHNTEMFRTDCYPGTITTIKKKCSPLNYKITNINNRRIVELYAPRVKISRYTGEEVTSGSSTTIVDGGNKIYTKYDTKLGTWPIKIVVSGLAAGSTITNDKCDVNVKKIDYKYRPIDVSNPFINSSWQKGKNWVNSKFDFTKTIHATTWSERARNTIRLKASDITALKKSNANYQSSHDSPYLGICERVSTGRYDSITRTICSKIR